jgi:hypothetical protein
MKEEWLFRGALVPIDAATTAALVAEIKRLIDVVGGMALAQPEQEPVAWLTRDDGDGLWYSTNFKQSDDDRPLYTSPPKREWAGLTDEEREVCMDEYYRGSIAFAIEAKLKDKNA